MATVDVPWDWFVFRIQADIVKVTKLELPTDYHFSTAEERTSLWVDSTPPHLFRVKFQIFLSFIDFDTHFLCLYKVKLVLHNTQLLLKCCMNF